ncbi:FecR domain-containing protein [Chitinophaga sp.]|uniref:FecR family protein n=1 Tax=Chitinophaga sp. TaxID=1869181 RepID=UPI0031DE0F0D
MKKRRNWQPVALGLILAMLITAGALYYAAGRHTTPSVLLEPGQRYTMYQCPYGKRKAVTLADSTVVLLNSRSRLYVPAGFPQARREVILDGEAFFNVRQALPQQFTLHTDKLNITSPSGNFRIRSLEKQSGATMYLLAGKANVGKSYHSDTDNERENLSAGEMILANKDIDLMEKETFTLAEQQDCLEGKLVFDNTPLPAALKKMEDWFGVEVELKGRSSSISKAVSGVFRNDSLQDMLATLGDSIGFTYRITRDKVVIKF